MIDYQAAFDSARSYDDFLARYDSEDQKSRWAGAFARFEPTADQKDLLGGFVREMNLLCLAGTWCGDCANQCPILERLARASARINLRFVDRDDSAALAAELRICGGNRIPVVVFLSEDFAECGRYGDRTLSKYRQMAVNLSGFAGPTARAGTSPTGEVAQEWLNEFERIQLMLRLSPRLRERHGD